MAEEIGSTWYKSQPSHLFFLMGDILLCKHTQAEPPGEGPSYILLKMVFTRNFFVEI